MSDVALEGFGGGGGNPLNFKVVGNPQPTNPKVNTIWLNTDTPINGYQFAAEQPEGMQPGEVWIITGTASQLAFNALKKNTVMVYPLSAKQMQADGTLADVTAKSWQNGEWVDWIKYLYVSGALKNELADGFTPLLSTTTVVQEENCIKYYDTNISSQLGGMASVNAIDVTGFSTLNIKARISFATTATEKYKCGLSTTKSPTNFASFANIPYSSSNVVDIEVPCPVDGGMYYLVFTCGGISDPGSQYVEITEIVVN